MARKLEAKSTSRTETVRFLALCAVSAAAIVGSCGGPTQRPGDYATTLSDAGSQDANAGGKNGVGGKGGAGGLGGGMAMTGGSGGMTGGSGGMAGGSGGMTGGSGGMAGGSGGMAGGGIAMAGGTAGTAGAGGSASGGAGMGMAGMGGGGAAMGGAGQGAGGAPVSPDLVAWWKMDETAGQSVANSAGSENQGTFKNLPAQSWVAGKHAGALRCDGSGGVVVPYSPSINGITNGLTIAVWVKLENSAGNAGVVLSRQIGQTYDEHFWLGFLGGRLTGRSDPGEIGHSSGLSSGTWQHVAFTFDGSMLRLYMNATLVKSLSGTKPIASDTTGLVICGNQSDASGNIEERFTGLVDDLRLYKRALSVAEITALAQ